MIELWRSHAPYGGRPIWPSKPSPGFGLALASTCLGLSLDPTEPADPARFHQGARVPWLTQRGKGRPRRSIHLALSSPESCLVFCLVSSVVSIVYCLLSSVKCLVSSVVSDVVSGVQWCSV